MMAVGGFPHLIYQRYQLSLLLKEVKDSTLFTQTAFRTQSESN
jgi:hypothetical protein